MIAGLGLSFDDGFQLLVAGLAIGMVLGVIAELTRVRG